MRTLLKVSWGKPITIEASCHKSKNLRPTILFRGREVREQYPRDLTHQ